MLPTYYMQVPSQPLSDVAHRRAINASGHLGSLYDLCRDSLIPSDNRNVAREPFVSAKSTKCLIIRGGSDSSFNILRSIDVESDLRLSLLLNITPKIGIASVLNHPDRMDEHIRFVYYSSVDREERISNVIMQDQTFMSSQVSTKGATHLVTGIRYGVDALVLLQPTRDTNFITDIDHILQKVSHAFSNGHDISQTLTNEDIDRLKRINSMTVYSNMPELTGFKDFSQLLLQLQILTRNPKSCSPITYFLQPLKSSHLQNRSSNTVFHSAPTELSDTLEQYILQKRNVMANIAKYFQDDFHNYFSGYLAGRFYGAQVQYTDMTKKFTSDIENLSKMLVDFRHGLADIHPINSIVGGKSLDLFNDASKEILEKLHDFKEKGHLIRILSDQNILYWNVLEFDVNKNDNEASIRSKLNIVRSNDRVFCSDDNLNKLNQNQFTNLRASLIEQRRQNPKLRLIYADFAYSSYKLHNMTILSSTNRYEKTHQSLQDPHTGFSHTAKSNSSIVPEQHPRTSIGTRFNLSRPVPAIDDDINILLLGESGVGKSTFINALASYLAYDSLEQAQRDKPVTVIPVASTGRISNRFQEITIKYSELNNANNENFNSVGQPATKHCKSYLFTFRDSGRRKLRIIDTPGSVDTRNVDQNDQNMEQILQYVNNLTHLNAICFLVNPNESRLNTFFRTCLTTLFSLIDRAARNNIMFCFTNARSTSFTSGKAGPVLNSMLRSSSMDDIPFQKQNTFCFDNESLQYLLALNNFVSFTNQEKNEYALSWSTSAKEYHRLIDYISINCVPCPIRNGHQSIKYAQFAITRMIRPILETIRNTLRNIVLCKMNMSHVAINLMPTPVRRPTANCFSCKRLPVLIGHFWMLLDNSHDFEDSCYSCSCAPNQHIPIDYTIEYRTVNSAVGNRIDEMEKMLHQIYVATAEFSQFLIHSARSTNDDPFVLGLMRMIRKEKTFCTENQPHEMNKHLMRELEIAQRDYEQRVREIVVSENRTTLGKICESIQMIRHFPGICEQILAGERGQTEIMKYVEVIL